MKLHIVTALSCIVASSALAEDTVARGAYLAQIMDCAGCHMPRDATGMPVTAAGLSGGTVGFEIPGLGIFWPPNLTPDPSGLGGWTTDEIKAAIRAGTRPDGRALAPAMPWQGYAALSEADLDALVAFLAAQAPVAAPRLEPIAQADQAQAPFYRVTLPN